MLLQTKVEEQSDSLINLLTSQCSDLEKLLSLAREETVVAESGNFDELLQIVSERAKLGDKLVVFQQQIADLRIQLGAAAEPALQSPLASKIATLVNQVLTQDSLSRPWLVAARTNAINSLAQIHSATRSTNAYTRETTKGLAYDQTI